MKRSKSSTKERRFVVCLRNDGNPASLEVLKIYRVLPARPHDDPQDIRVIDESGEDYLYPRENFSPIKLPSKALQLVGH